jgi:hypothetical protein
MWQFFHPQESDNRDVLRFYSIATLAQRRVIRPIQTTHTENHILSRPVLHLSRDLFQTDTEASFSLHREYGGR